MLKLIGGLAIIIATTSIGYVYSMVYEERVKQLRELQYALNILESEIIYSTTPIVDALKAAADNSKTAIGVMLVKISELLSQRSVSSIYDAYVKASKELKNQLYLEKEEKETIGSFVHSLGSADIEGQKKNFNITVKKLEGFEKKAEVSRDKNAKLYRYIGLFGGVLIVLLLV